MKRTKKTCMHCGKKSIPGLKRNVGLCQYHYDAIMFGEEWASYCHQSAKQVKAYYAAGSSY